MTPHPLTKIQFQYKIQFKKKIDSLTEIQKYYQNQTRFNGVYKRDNLPDKTKDGCICNKS